MQLKSEILEIEFSSSITPEVISPFFLQYILVDTEYVVKIGGLDSHRQLLVLEKDLDISKYYLSIFKRGGIERVEKQNRWHDVLVELGFPEPVQPTSIVSLRCIKSLS